MLPTKWDDSDTTKWDVSSVTETSGTENDTIKWDVSSDISQVDRTCSLLPIQSGVTD